MSGQGEKRTAAPLTCHACGSRLVTKKGYYLARTLACPNPDCPDKKGLPAPHWTNQ